MARFPWQSVPSALYVGRRRPRRRLTQVATTGALCPPFTPVLKVVEDSIVQSVVERSTQMRSPDINEVTDWAYRSIYPTGPFPIPAGWQYNATCRPWAEAWLRLRDAIIAAALPNPALSAAPRRAVPAVGPTGSRTYSPFNLDSRGVPIAAFAGLTGLAGYRPYFGKR